MIKTSSKTPKFQVLTGPERRRRWVPAEKSSMVCETYEPGMTVSSVARRPSLHWQYEKVSCRAVILPKA